MADVASPADVFGACIEVRVGGVKSPTAIYVGPSYQTLGRLIWAAHVIHCKESRTDAPRCGPRGRPSRVPSPQDK